MYFDFGFPSLSCSQIILMSLHTQILVLSFFYWTTHRHLNKQTNKQRKNKQTNKQNKREKNPTKMVRSTQSQK